MAIGLLTVVEPMQHIQMKNPEAAHHVPASRGKIKWEIKRSERRLGFRNKISSL